MARDPLRLVAGDVLLCTGFFTRIPARGPVDRRLADAIWAAPIVGVVVGLTGALAFRLADWLSLPPTIAAACALAVTILITGGLHEDGLADVADGFGGGATRQRKLEIMKDSRIGTFGVLALLISVLLRWSALVTLADSVSVFVLLAASHIASRATMPLMMAVLPPARLDGLSANAGAVPVKTGALAAMLGFLGLLLLGPSAAIVAATALLVAFLGLMKLAQHQIGGQTGDVLGALEQVGEIVVLLVAVSIFLPV
ncbi:MAG: adenosylcobinamide-GDP ribazoletransferase [Rhizobiaceae bacterium]|nr:adenosylcobinamide-GDP ribazoletransferase [Rhizobiaceae bacterium]